jgi:hypothetical protein
MSNSFSLTPTLPSPPSFVAELPWKMGFGRGEIKRSREREEMRGNELTTLLFLC